MKVNFFSSIHIFLQAEVHRKRNTKFSSHLFCRQESIKQAEKERRIKYKKQDDEREVIRSALREKVKNKSNSLYMNNKLETPCDFFKRAIVNSLKISVNYCQKYSCHQKLYFQYNIDKPANEEDYEDEDEDEDGFTGILIFHGRIHRSYPIFHFQKVCQ